MENKLAPLFFIFGIIFLILGFLKGEMEGGLFIIFPFIYGTGIFSMFGVILIFISFLLYFLSIFSRLEIEYTDEAELKRMEKKSGGIIFIGPFPIIVSSDTKFAFILLLLALIFMMTITIAFLFFFFK